jgi:hypothetical protein
MLGVFAEIQNLGSCRVRAYLIGVHGKLTIVQTLLTPSASVAQLGGGVPVRRLKRAAKYAAYFYPGYGRSLPILSSGNCQSQVKGSGPQFTGWSPASFGGQ